MTGVQTCALPIFSLLISRSSLSHMRSPFGISSSSKFPTTTFHPVLFPQHEAINTLPQHSRKLKLKETQKAQEVRFLSDIPYTPESTTRTCEHPSSSNLTYSLSLAPITARHIPDTRIREHKFLIEVGHDTTSLGLDSNLVFGVSLDNNVGSDETHAAVVLVKRELNMVLGVIDGFLKSMRSDGTESHGLRNRELRENTTVELNVLEFEAVHGERVVSADLTSTIVNSLNPAGSEISGLELAVAVSMLQKGKKILGSDCMIKGRLLPKQGSRSTYTHSTLNSITGNGLAVLRTCTETLRKSEDLQKEYGKETRNIRCFRIFHFH